MKKLILAAVLVVSTLTFAQEKVEKREKLTPEQQTEKRVNRLKEELSLNEKQVEEVKILSKEQIEKRNIAVAKFKERKQAGEKPNKEEMQAMKESREKEKSEMEAKMKSILTPEQYEKWLNIMEENKDKMHNAIKNRKKGKNKKVKELKD